MGNRRKSKQKMAKIKLTKNELKKQKDALKRFERYLPTLQLKKQQLQTVIRRIEGQREEVNKKHNALSEEIMKWAAVFGQEIKIDDLIQLDKVELEEGNIAGVDIPVFKSVTFQEVPYDLFLMPLWVDEAVEKIKMLLTLFEELSVLEEQIKLLAEELRITNQRVNLFEKVKIPEANENIRKILVFLGDQQTAAVVRGKISKNKLAKVS
jgi:V/A-type H+-transporting ATPase subunit D